LNKLNLLGKFQENGGVNCGYILKPNFMLTNINSSEIKYPYQFKTP